MPDTKADQVGLADKNVETAQFERYKGRKDQTDRVGILSSTLTRVWSYWYEGGGKRTQFRAPTDEATIALVKEQLGEPDQRFGFVVFHYRTDEKGALFETEKCQGRPKLWIISEARYEEMSNIHRQWPLMDTGFAETQHDMLIRCTEENWQRMNFTPCPEAHWKKKEAWHKALKGKENLAQQALKKALGRNLSPEEIVALLGASTAGITGSTGNAGDVDLGDVVDED